MLAVSETPEQQQTRQHLGIHIGDDPAMQSMWRGVHIAALSPNPILVTGEKGSGVQTIARSIAELRLRLLGQNIENIASIDSFLPSSDFEKVTIGSPTSSGRLVDHSDGMIILNDVESLTPISQSLIHSILSEPRVFRVPGSSTDVQFKGKVIATSHTDWKTIESEGRMNEGLFRKFKFGGIVKVPALLERNRQHITELVQLFAHDASRGVASNPIRITDSAMSRILSSEFPENIEGLRATVQTSVLRVIQAQRTDLLTSDIQMPESPLGNGSHIFAESSLSSGLNGDDTSLYATRDALEKQVIEQALAKNHHSRTKTARELGISRVTLYNKMKKYGLMTGNENEGSASTDRIRTIPR